MGTLVTASVRQPPLREPFAPICFSCLCIMDPIITGIIAAVVALPIGWMLGQGAGRRPFEDALGVLARGLQNGEVADVKGSPEGVRAVAKALGSAWAPVGDAPRRAGRSGDAAKEYVVPETQTTPSDTVRQEALWEALQRVNNHLATTIQQPLIEASTGDTSDLREGVEQALGALADIEFFLGTPPQGKTEIDLGEAVREVIADFSATSSTRPKQRGPRRPVHVTGNPDALKDALFLVLHNAEQFGEGRPIDVVVRVEDGHGRVHVRDRGRGFSAEALSRAYDPFYTTVDGNLGLGLAHARQLIEDSGGKIRLLNSERGGGEVEIGLPLDG